MPESTWVDNQLAKSKLPYGMVCGIDMQGDATEYIEFNKKIGRFRGFRQMTNWDEEKQMAIDKTITKNIWEDSQVVANLKKLEEAGATFDLLAEPCQWDSIAKALSLVPKLTVIIDHRAVCMM